MATLRSLTVNGSPSFSIPAGESIITDPVRFSARRESNLDVSFYVPDGETASAIHYGGLQTSSLAAGNQTAMPRLLHPSETMMRLIVMGVEVATPIASSYIIAAIGSSTTGGSHSTPNENRRWTDALFRRLALKYGDRIPSVVNLGIAGNRVVHDAPNPSAGQSAVYRFSRDVLMQGGIKYVIAFEGGNDIRLPGAGAIPASEAVTAEQLISGFRMMARQAHQQHVKFIVGTITAFEHSTPN